MLETSQKCQFVASLEDNVRPTSTQDARGRFWSTCCSFQGEDYATSDCHRQTADSAVTEQAEAQYCSLFDDQARPKAIPDFFVHDAASGDAELQCEHVTLYPLRPHTACAIPDSSPNARCRPSHNRDISAWRPAADGSNMSPSQRLLLVRRASLRHASIRRASHRR